MIELRPSGSYRWSRCAAAPTFESKIPPEPDSDEAREGTAAAWVADCVLKGDAHSAEDMLGETHANGWLVTPDMVFYVQQYIDLIKSRGGVTTTEQFVRLSPVIAGTFDSSTSIEGSSVLHVDDLKYGFKIHEVFEHTQLIIYGAAEALRLIQSGRTITRVILGIFQPRAFHPEGIYRTWTLTIEQLWEYAHHLIARGEMCQAPQPVATPGNHCDHCRARTSCAALAMSVYKDYSVVEDHRQRHLSAEELSAELTFLEQAERRLKSRKEAIEAEALERVKNRKEHVRGWFMKERHGHRKFTVHPLVVKYLTGVEPYKPVLVTPAELEREGANPEIVSKIAQTPVIGYKLSPMPANYLEGVFRK